MTRFLCSCVFRIEKRILFLLEKISSRRGGGSKWPPSTLLPFSCPKRPPAPALGPDCRVWPLSYLPLSSRLPQAWTVLIAWFFMSHWLQVIIVAIYWSYSMSLRYALCELITLHHYSHLIFTTTPRDWKLLFQDEETEISWDSEVFWFMIGGGEEVEPFHGFPVNQEMEHSV